MSEAPGETVHASCVAIDGRAVLIAGPSGSGKSDLSLRLIDRGAALVSDDYTELSFRDGRLLARAPAAISGKIEVRGVGIVDFAPAQDALVALVVELGEPVERLPKRKSVTLAGIEIPAVALAALEASAPLKVERALQLFGLPLP